MNCAKNLPGSGIGRCNERWAHRHEMWPSHQSLIDALSDDTLFVTSKPSGLLGLTQMFVPKFFVDRHPSFRQIAAYTDRNFLAKHLSACHWGVLQSSCSIVSKSWKVPSTRHWVQTEIFFDDSMHTKCLFQGLFVIDPENNCLQTHAHVLVI